MKCIKSLLQTSRLPVGSTQPPIQSVPVDQLLGTKCLKLPHCVIRGLSRCLYLRNLPHLLSDITVTHKVFFFHWNASQRPLPFLNTQGIREKIKTTTEFLFNINYKPGCKNYINLFTMPDTALQYMASWFFYRHSFFILLCFISFYFTFKFRVWSNTLVCPQ